MGRLAISPQIVSEIPLTSHKERKKEAPVISSAVRIEVPGLAREKSPPSPKTSSFPISKVLKNTEKSKG